MLLVVELYGSSALTREKFGWGFLLSRNWDPVAEKFGALPFIYGTVVTSLVALLIAVPLGVGAAIFLAELAPPKISDALTFVVELLAAVPSVIYGLLAVFVLVPPLREHVEPFLQQRLGFLPFFQGPMYGVGLLAAGLILAIMILPFIVSISREALLAVPAEQREAALALGATRWEATWQVVVPYARLGIMGSIFLALARALGETMAVTMVIGNTPQDQRLAVRAGLLDRGRDRQRVHRGDEQHARERADRTGAGAVRSDHPAQRRRAAAARGHHAEGNRSGMSYRYYRRKTVNLLMFSMTGLCALFTVSVLFFILGFLVWNGARSINWDFFTQLPKPVGETGGGMANAIVGSAKLLLLASLIGVPIGFVAGVYLAEFGGTRFPFVVRYMTDLLNGVPSIVIGIFAYALVVVPDEAFLDAGRRVGPEHDDDSDHRAQHGAVSPGRAPSLARRRAGAGREQVADGGYGGDSGRHARNPDGHACWAWPGWRARRRRCCSPVSATASGPTGGISRPRRCR